MLAEDNKLAVRSLAALEEKLRSRNLRPKIITGHTGWTDSLDIACFAYREVMPEGQRENTEEFTQTVALVFNGETVKKRNPELFTANNRALLKLIGPLLRIVFVPMNRRVDSGQLLSREQRVAPTMAAGCG